VLSFEPRGTVNPLVFQFKHDLAGVRCSCLCRSPVPWLHEISREASVQVRILFFSFPFPFLLLFSSSSGYDDHKSRSYEAWFIPVDSNFIGFTEPLFFFEFSSIFHFSFHFPFHYFLVLNVFCPSFIMSRTL